MLLTQTNLVEPSSGLARDEEHPLFGGHDRIQALSRIVRPIQVRMGVHPVQRFVQHRLRPAVRLGIGGDGERAEPHTGDTLLSSGEITSCGFPSPSTSANVMRCRLVSLR